MEETSKERALQHRKTDFTRNMERDKMITEKDKERTR